jgi:hypothetical protein
MQAMREGVRHMIATFSGKLGDFIYALPVFKATGIRHLELVANKWRWDASGAAELARRQSYIDSAYSRDTMTLMDAFHVSKPTFPMDAWRNNYNPNLNLTDMMCKWIGVDYPNRLEPWIECKAVNSDAILINRSLTYQNETFPWYQVIKSIIANKRPMFFVGTMMERLEFMEMIQAKHDHQFVIHYLETKSIHELVSYIASCRAVVANQSAVRAIAEGLKKPVFVEQCPDCPNTHWERPDAHYWTRPGDRIPEELFR